MVIFKQLIFNNYNVLFLNIEASLSQFVLITYTALAKNIRHLYFFHLSES